MQANADRRSDDGRTPAALDPQLAVFNWGAAGGWPELDPERLEESPLVTVTLTEVGGQTEMSLRVDLPQSLAPDKVQEWWSTGFRDGWRDTVDRLAAALESAAPVS